MFLRPGPLLNRLPTVLHTLMSRKKKRPRGGTFPLSLITNEIKDFSHLRSFDHLRVCTKQTSSTKFPLRHKRHRVHLQCKEKIYLAAVNLLPRVVRGSFENHASKSKLFHDFQEQI